MSADTIQQRLAEMPLFVAVSQGDEVVGTIGYKTVGHEEGHIRGMAVRPDHEGRGVAQKLLETVETELRQRGCSRISLDSTAPLKRAIRFYERNGFRLSGRVRELYGMSLFEHVRMLK